MRPEDHDAAYLWDLLTAARDVVRFMGHRTSAQYSADDVLKSAIERKIEIMGEAARRVSQAFQEEHPEIPWRRIIAQRNVLAHEYGAVEDHRVWLVATVHIPELLGNLMPLIPEPPAEPEP